MCPNDDHEDQLPSYLRRMSSFSIGKEDLLIFVVDKDGSEMMLDESLEEDLDELVSPMGGGAQGKIYAAKVAFKNEKGDLEYRNCVLKHIPKKRYAIQSEQSPFEAHRKISEQDQTSTQNNAIKLIKIVTHHDQEFALLPYCDVFLDKAVGALQESSPSFFFERESLQTLFALHVLSDLCDAFISLHLDKNAVHRDVKPENIAFYRGHWCLIDMDCAKEIGQPVDYYSGTPAFSHPSVIHDRNNSTNPSTDLFALGKIILSIFGMNEVGSDVAEKGRQYREALAAKYGDGKFGCSLDILSSCNNAKEKILAIAELLMQPLASDQIDLLTLRTLLDELLQSKTDYRYELEERLELFYSHIRSDGFFDPQSTISPKKYPARISIFSEARSNSQCSAYTSDESNSTTRKSSGGRSNPCGLDDPEVLTPKN